MPTHFNDRSQEDPDIALLEIAVLFAYIAGAWIVTELGDSARGLRETFLP